MKLLVPVSRGLFTCGEESRRACSEDTVLQPRSVLYYFVHGMLNPKGLFQNNEHLFFMVQRVFVE